MRDHREIPSRPLPPRRDRTGAILIHSEQQRPVPSLVNRFALHSLVLVLGALVAMVGLSRGGDRQGSHAQSAQPAPSGSAIALALPSATTAPPTPEPTTAQVDATATPLPPSPTALPSPTAVPTSEPTAVPTALPSPTPAPTPEPEPTAMPTLELSVRELRAILPRPVIRLYTVESGDTLNDLAQRFEISVDTLRWANGIPPDDGDLIYEGQQLIILPVSGVMHTAVGESIRMIAERYGVDAERLSEYNGIEDPDEILDGERIVVPGAHPLSDTPVAPMEAGQPRPASRSTALRALAAAEGRLLISRDARAMEEGVAEAPPPPNVVANSVLEDVVARLEQQVRASSALPAPPFGLNALPGADDPAETATDSADPAPSPIVVNGNAGEPPTLAPTATVLPPSPTPPLPTATARAAATALPTPTAAASATSAAQPRASVSPSPTAGRAPAAAVGSPTPAAPVVATVVPSATAATTAAPTVMPPSASATPHAATPTPASRAPATARRTPRPRPTQVFPTVPPRSPRRARPAPPTAVPTRPAIFTYTVQPGDTLNSLGERFGISAATIAVANNLTNADTLVIGQELVILPVSGVLYVVEEGDTLADIAARFKVDLGPIIDFNQLTDADIVRPGDKLIVPGARIELPGSQPTPEPERPSVVDPDEIEELVDDSTPASLAEAEDAPDLTAADGEETPVTRASDADEEPSATVEEEPAARAPQGAQQRATVGAPAPSVDEEAALAESGDASLGETIAALALKYLGRPYVFGGSSPSGFDCSGFVWYVLKQSGTPVSRGLFGQYSSGSHPRLSQLQPGDLVFFENTYMPGLSHNGIYLGGGKFVHAVDEASGVAVSDINDSYWASRYYGATRPW